MDINLNNYEAYFLDYHEGTLSPEQVAELMLFVEQHPELKAELESYEPVPLNGLDDGTVFPGKDNLKKGPVTAENFEEMAVAFVEGTLPAELQKDLLAFAEQYPFYKVQLGLFAKSVLPHEKVVFDRKDALKKKEADVLSPQLQLTEAEMLMIASVEGIITPSQQKQLDLLLKQEQYKKEFAHYRSAKLTAEAVVFPGKQSLKRKAGSRRLFYYYAAAAASVALLLGFWFFPGSSTVNTGADFAWKSKPLYRDATPGPEENDGNANSLANTNDAKNGEKQHANDSAPVLVKHNEQPWKQDEQPPVKKEEKIIIANQPVPDSTKNNPVVKQDGEESSYNDIVLVNTFHDPEEYPSGPNNHDDYLTLRQAVSYKVKNALLKDEMSDTGSYREDRKKITWYDAVLVLMKGVRRVSGRDLEVKKRYNDNNELIAYQFSAGKYTYTKPVGKNN